MCVLVWVQRSTTALPPRVCTALPVPHNPVSATSALVQLDTVELTVKTVSLMKIARNTQGFDRLFFVTRAN